MSSTFCPFCANFLNRKSSRADYTVVARRCQVLFTAIVPNFLLASLCGVEYNYGRFWGQSATNLR
jgi:hypothetical protein